MIGLRSAVKLIVAAYALTASGCAKHPPAACAATPAPSSYALPQGGSRTEQAARELAARCIHHEAYRLAAGPGDNEAIALGAMGACLDQIQSAQGVASFNGVTPAAPPVGYYPTVEGRRGASEAPAELTPEINKVREQLSERVFADLRLIALYRVAEARALGCQSTAGRN